MPDVFSGQQRQRAHFRHGFPGAIGMQRYGTRAPTRRNGFTSRPIVRDKQRRIGFTYDVGPHPDDAGKIKFRELTLGSPP